MKKSGGERGQSLIEATIVLTLTLIILFGICKLFLNKTLQITREIQISDFLKYGHILRNNKFIDRRTSGERTLNNDDDFDISVTIEKFAITEEEEELEKYGLFDGRDPKTRPFAR
ncbi:MAG: hypothetical protein A3F16_01505 [Deltaproteobacteria bacterium RIFCSPHIGHO2_12_FULL_43_9]|nr:MAG: hypothetical protein A3F16_01505 [Deltaproteobacteria bacterium RIFCSPHIGHO2_12_FULL_43_9]